MNQTALDRAFEWIKNPLIEHCDKEDVQNLLDKKNYKELEEIFQGDLEFGTGGIRSILGMGSSRINKYTIRKATQAFANALIKANGGDSIRMAISYDSRHGSTEFSKEVCQVLTGNGFKCFLSCDIRPTPMLSYFVRKLECHGGVMITASHNPQIYNGYKVYWSDGCQVTPPYDDSIIDEYAKITSLDQIKLKDFDLALSDKSVEFISSEIEESYFSIIEENCFQAKLTKERGEDLKIVYSPLHGTGAWPIKKAFKQLGYKNLLVVPEQEKPDGDFPTVNPPNPEEPQALKLSINLMQETKADYCFATDPDTDRLGVVINHNGDSIILTGNQIGALLLNYILEMKKSKDDLGENPILIKTIVTSTFQNKIANTYGVKVYDTLTGFKWICRKIKELEDKNEKFDFIFANEESFGYLSHLQARDKDAVNAATLFAEMALSYKLQGQTIIDKLDELYLAHGYSLDQLLSLHYLGIEGKKKIDRIMEYFRNYQDSKVQEILKNDTLINICDYKSGTSLDPSTNKTSKLQIPSSNVLIFHFESGSRLCLRPSGTEPKIKFYLQLVDQKMDKKNSQTRADEICRHIKSLCEEL